MRFKIRTIFPYLVISLISTLYMYQLFDNIHNTGRGDWDQFCFFDEFPRISIIKYHQFPLWDPYESGGRPSWTNLRYSFLRPTSFFVLLFGCVVGLKFEIFITMTMGMIGMFLLSRDYKMKPLAGLASSFIFGLCSFFSLHIQEGHPNFLGLNLLPYVFLFFLKSFYNRKNILFSSTFLAMMLIWDVGHWLIPILFFFSTYGFVMSIQTKSFKPGIYVILIFTLAFGLGAIKFIPTFEYGLEHSRLISSDEFTTLKGVYDIFMNREQHLEAKHFDEQVWGWHEYGAYTGLLPLLFTALGILFFWRTQIALIIAGFLSFTISLGNFAKWSPWFLLHKLPVIDSLHVPSRFTILVIFSIAIISGLAASKILETNRKSLMRRFVIFLLFILILDLFFVSRQPLLNVYPYPQAPVSVNRSKDIQQTIDHVPLRSAAASSMYLNLISNKGTLNAYDNIPHEVFAKSFDDPNYRGEVYLEGNGSASYSYWSPNKLIVNVNVPDPTRLIINQNYDAGWRVKGKVTENFHGLLSTVVTPSDKSVEFYYLPLSFMVGLFITFVSITFVVVCILSKTKDKMKTHTAKSHI